MNTFTAKETLPEGYAESEKVDLVRNKKQMLLVNGLALALAVCMALLGMLIAPEGHTAFFDLKNHAWATAFKCLITVAGLIVYLIGHEAVHGVFMWHYSHVKPNFGLSFTYAYAGSECYFGKKAYLMIALAPLVLWGFALFIAALLVPAGWFWAVWAIQLMNVSGAAGDLFVFTHMLRKPETILVQDTGTAMTVYLPEQ